MIIKCCKWCQQDFKCSKEIKDQNICPVCSLKGAIKWAILQRNYDADLHLTEIQK